MNTAVGPVPVKERIAILDIIRGFALFGVLLVNMLMFNYTLTDFSFGRDALARPDLLVGALDRAVVWTIQVLFQGKFYTIFAFLFGLGFYLFLERGADKQETNNKLFRRRLFVLLAAGLLHLIFVWWGDVLAAYALIGFLLPLFSRMSLARLRTWIVVLLVISLLIYAGALAMTVMVGGMLGTPDLPLFDPARAVYAQGTYWAGVQYRLQNEVAVALLNTVAMLPRILGLFLLGVYAAKTGILQNTAAYLPLIGRLFRLGAVVGIGLSLLHLGLQFAGSLFWAGVLREVSTPFLSLFYVSGIMLLWQGGKFTALWAYLAPLGRMAFTNYLVQCIICAWLFYGHGLGLMGNISLSYIPLLTLLIYASQAFYSKWWLAKYPQGPAEWLWRRLTYGV
ncbi:MAG: hypothetical protein DDT34_01974 [Firmicutes bacterium]|nr:hypothetical protein [Bacillota bacterium]